MSCLFRNMQLVVINGPGGCGKDTFIDYCNNYLDVDYFDTVECIKEAAEILGWNGSKDEKSRQFLHDLKMLSIRYNDLPFADLSRYVAFVEENAEHTSYPDLLFVHVREKEEIERIVEEFNAVTLLITSEREGYEEPDLDFEKATKEINYNFHIVNDGSLEDLDKRAERFCEVMEELINEDIVLGDIGFMQI